MVVNVATQCGLTKNNYKQLNELFEKYESEGLRIAAFPCNQFGNQEPGCSVDIKGSFNVQCCQLFDKLTILCFLSEFIKKNDVKFDMYSKVEVNGDNAIPLYKWLKKEQGGFLGFDGIKWNFTKFLTDKEGKPVKRYAPTTEPKTIEPDIKSLV